VIPAAGQPVADAETLHRVIVPAAAAVWFPNGVLSSAAFNYPVFSVDVAGLAPVANTLARWPAGSGVVGFGCGVARGLGFDARHAPENGNDAHADVHCAHPPNERKRRARQLAGLCQVVVLPGTPGP
jgi:hypothetical protein